MGLRLGINLGRGVKVTVGLRLGLGVKVRIKG
jgi:hypothetical protein